MSLMILDLFNKVSIPIHSSILDQYQIGACLQYFSVMLSVFYC